MKKVLSLSLMIIFLAGCTSVLRQDLGSKTLIPDNINKIERGKTTQKEILAIFGEPMSKTMAGQFGTMWTYSRSTSSTTTNFFAFAPKYEARGTALTVTFDNDSLVKDYYYSEVNPIQEGTVTYERK
jgi:outer membrane protein assembly factor BamE (lipoprotein component of BamABCDE complex)